jgi:hypothetical protein
MSEETEEPRLDFKAIPHLTKAQWAEYEILVAKSKAALAPKCAKIKAAFIRNRTKELVAEGMDEAKARTLVTNQANGTLLPGLVLPFDDPDLAGTTVGDVLRDPERYIDETLADPLEGIAYGPCKAKILRGVDGGLVVHSFAHGGAMYPMVHENGITPDDVVEVEQNSRQESKPDDQADELLATIADGHGNGTHGKTPSAVQWYVIHEMLRRGYAPESIAKTLLAKRNGIARYSYQQTTAKPRVYVKREIAKAVDDCKLSYGESGLPVKTPDNINLAILKLGVRLSYDEFADRMLIEGLDDLGPGLNDQAMLRIYFRIDQVFGFRPKKEMIFDVIRENASINRFHPVRDYLDSLKWDGKPRIDRWMTDYLGAPLNDYTRAIGSLMLVAAVHRVYAPGCKFDEMVVFEDPRQGTNKSMVLRILAVRPEWFTDDLPLSLSGKQVIEQTSGKWLIEAAELDGMKRTDITHLKALLSRQTDRARLAYDRVAKDVPRQCIFVGTTNNIEYLKDTTGNRRFWPVRVGEIDIKALKRDRDQLWAEACERESEGASIRLPRRLWPVAAKEQAKRLTADPYVATLDHHLGEFETGKITAETVWKLLEVKGGQRHQDISRRIGDAMRVLGWKRSKSRMIKVEGRKVVGYFKGYSGNERCRRLIIATLDSVGSPKAEYEEKNPMDSND